MKINKILLRISHFFNYRLDEEHQDDITINITSTYPVDELEDLLFYQHSSWIIDDVFAQIYKRFKEDPIIEKRCRNIKQVWITFCKTSNYDVGNRVIQIPYFDGLLYNPYDFKSMNRQMKIDKLLS